MTDPINDDPEDVCCSRCDDCGSYFPDYQLVWQQVDGSYMMLCIDCLAGVMS